VDYYLLDDDGRTPRPCADLVAWARWYATADRVVARDAVGTLTVSTVFLGLDHNWGLGPPLLWETMVFGLPDDNPMWRYATYDEALTGHAAAVELARAAQG
jgi:hypothetical protein